MLLERTISQLDIGPLPPERAADLGQMGYVQWLGGLPGAENYHEAARRACAAAEPFRRHSPAVAVFCDLLVASTGVPLRPLDIAPARRGTRAARGRLTRCAASRRSGSCA